MEESNREEGGEQDVTLSAADADGSIRLLNLIIGKDHQLWESAARLAITSSQSNTN